MLSAGLGFALLALLTRTLAPNEFGVVSPIVALLDLVVAATDALLVTGTIQLAARHAADAPQRAERILRVSLGLRLAIGCLVAAAGSLAAGAISEVLLGSRDWEREVRLAFLAVPFMSAYTFATSALQLREHFSRLASLALAKNGFRLALVGLVVLLGLLSISRIIDAIFWAAAACLVVALVVTERRLWRPLFDASVCRELFRINKWMALAIVGLLGARVDIFMLSMLGTPTDVGLYAAAAQLCVAVAMLSSAVATTLLPKAAKLRSLPELRDHYRRSLRLLPVGVGAGALTIAVAAPLLPIVLGEGYAGATPSFVLLGASAFLTLLTNPVLMLLFPMGLVHFYAFGSVAQLLLRIVGNVFAIPLWGAAGAAGIDLAVKLVTIAFLIGVIRMRLANGHVVVSDESSIPRPVV